MLYALIIVLLLMYIAYYWITMRNVKTKTGNSGEPHNILSVNVSDSNVLATSDNVWQIISKEPTFFPDGYSVVVKIPKYVK